MKNIEKTNRFSKLKNERGITLIALVITIIILLILAGISIKAFTGSNIIEKAKTAVEKHEIAANLEKLNVEKTNYILKKNLDLDYNYQVKDFLQFAIDEKTIKKDNVENFDGLSNDAQSAIVKMDKYKYLVEKDTNEIIKITYNGKTDGDNIAPTVKITSSICATDSITVTVTAEDKESGMPDSPIYCYYIAEEGMDYSNTPNEQSNSNTYKFTKLKQNTFYKIKVTTKDKANNVGGIETAPESLKTASLPEDPDAYITVNAKWSNGNLTGAEILKKSSDVVKDFSMQYQVNTVNDNGWKNVNSGAIVSDVAYGDTIFVRLVDGSGNASGSVSRQILDVDGPVIIYLYHNGYEPVLPDAAIEIYYEIEDEGCGVDLASCRWVLDDEIHCTESGEYDDYLRNGNIIDINNGSSGNIWTTVSEWGDFKDIVYITFLAVDYQGNTKTGITSIMVDSSSSDLKTGDSVKVFANYNTYTYTREEDGEEIIIKSKPSEDYALAYEGYFCKGEDFIMNGQDTVFTLVPMDSIGWCKSYEADKDYLDKITMDMFDFFDESKNNNLFKVTENWFDYGTNAWNMPVVGNFVNQYDFHCSNGEGMIINENLQETVGSEVYNVLYNMSSGRRLLTGISAKIDVENGSGWGYYVLENGIMNLYSETEIKQMNDLMFLFAIYAYSDDISCKEEMGENYYYIGNWPDMYYPGMP